MDTLGGRLAAARALGFVGRAQPLRAFDEMLAGSSATHLMWLQGPGGIGKSTLLAAMADRARAAGADVRMVDAGGRPEAAELETAILASQGPGHDPVVVLVDGMEQLGHLEALLRDNVLTQLPGTSRVVLASRLAPGTRWRADLGWAGESATWVLGSFSRDEVADLLVRRGLGADHADELYAITAGYPLAVALAAQILAGEGGALPGGAAGRSELLRELLGRLLDRDPDAGQWQALQVLAVARCTNVDILASCVQLPADSAFAWLSGLSFVAVCGDGLAPHEIAREALLAELRWRAPATHAAVRARVHADARARLQSPNPAAAVTAANDLLHLHRSSPVLAGRLGPEASGLWVDQARPTDLPAILALVERHEGRESAALHRRWWETQQGAFLVVRDRLGSCQGFGLHLRLDDPAGPGSDPLARAAWDLVAGLAPLRPREHLRVIRSWIGSSEDYQRPGATNSVLTAAVARQVLIERGLAATVAFAVGESVWSGLYGYADYGRAVAGDVAIPGTDLTACAFLHDWRVCPPADWLDLLDSRLADPDAPAGEAGVDPGRATTIAAAIGHAARHLSGAGFVVLSQQQFVAAVRDALRGARDPAGLADSPLLATRVLRVRSGADRGSAADLREVLAQQVAALQAVSPTPGRAVELVYLGPARTQQAAASRMGLPFSTFRRHLAAGVSAVAAAMWHAETNG